jgi:putative transposase
MSYVRAKEIPPHSGNWYDYEVETIHEGKKVIQKYIRYLGKSGKHSYLCGGQKVLTSRLVVSPTPNAPKTNETRLPKMKIPASKIASALGMYYGGMSLDSIEQQFRQDHNLSMSETNYWNWVERFTKKAIRQCQDFHPEVGDTWVADETYMKLKNKTVYFWDIIDTKTKFILASHASFGRGAREARALMNMAEKRAGKAPKTVITDKLRSYVGAIEDKWGADTKHVQGGPFKFAQNGESTAEIERFHKTLKQRTEVFERFKDLSSIKLLTDGWLINYNYFKQNEGCGNIPPAQASSKVVPFKDWNDIVRDRDLPDIDYKVTTYKRPSAKKGNPVMDATLTPITK